MTSISIQGKYSTAEKNTHCTNIIELVNQEIWHTSEILKNKPGLQKHYNTMAWKHIYREYRVQHRETFRVWERLASFCNSFFPPFFFVWSTPYETHERQTSTAKNIRKVLNTVTGEICSGTSDTNSCRTQSVEYRTQWKKIFGVWKDMATVLGSVWPGPLAIYAPRLSNYFVHSQNGKKLWAERQVKISIWNDNGSCDQCNIYSSISCKPQINIMALKCGFKGEMGQERHLPNNFFFVFNITKL